MDINGCAPTVAPLVVPEIVALPEEIDTNNAEVVGGELHAAFRPGVSVVIADMSATNFCDSSAVRHLVRASERAAEVGAELRLAAESGAVLRVLEVTGVDRILRVYHGLQAALANTTVPGPEQANRSNDS